MDIPPIKQPASRGETVAVFFGASVAMVAVGLLNVLADISAPAKTFMTLNKKVGPWSGKVLFGYLLGIVAWFFAWLVFRKKGGNLVTWFWIFFASLGIATLFVFTPFLHFLLK